MAQTKEAGFLSYKTFSTGLWLALYHQIYMLSPEAVIQMPGESTCGVSAGMNDSHITLITDNIFLTCQLYYIHSSLQCKPL